MTTYNIETATMVTKETILGTKRQIENAHANDLDPTDVICFLVRAFNAPRAKGYTRTAHVTENKDTDTVTVRIEDAPSKP